MAIASTAAKLIAAVLLAALCFRLTAISINYADANTSYYQAQNHLIAKRDALPKASQVSSAHAYISQALEKAPIDADILDLAGRIDYFRSLYEPDPEKKLELLSLSKEKHLAALQERTFWPYSEVNILFASSAAGEIDEEFHNRFSRAKKLGSDDSTVIRDLTRLGIKNWNDLSSQAKHETVQMTESVLKRKLINLKDLRTYMYNNGQFHRICSQLRQFDEKQELCNS